MGKLSKKAKRYQRAAASHLGEVYIVTYRHNVTSGLIGRLVAADEFALSFVDCKHIVDGIRSETTEAMVKLPHDVVQSMGMAAPDVQVVIASAT